MTNSHLMNIILTCDEHTLTQFQSNRHRSCRVAGYETFRPSFMGNNNIGDFVAEEKEESAVAAVMWCDVQQSPGRRSSINYSSSSSPPPPQIFLTKVYRKCGGASDRIVNLNLSVVRSSWITGRLSGSLEGDCK